MNRHVKKIYTYKLKWRGQSALYKLAPVELARLIEENRIKRIVSDPNTTIEELFKLL